MEKSFTVEPEGYGDMLRQSRECSLLIALSSTSRASTVLVKINQYRFARCINWRFQSITACR
jgi:hypothetical protein